MNDCVSTIEELIYKSALRWPENIALSTDNEFFTYQQLASKCEKLKDALHARKIGKHARVGLYAEKSCYALISMLAIMSSGAAVVMLPYSDEPTDQLLENIYSTDIQLLVTLEPDLIPGYKYDQWNVQPLLEDETLVNATLSNRILPSDPAYFILTSGSSGKSKAVIVTNKNVLHYSYGIVSRLAMETHFPIVFGHLTTLSADLGYTAIFPTLTAGGRIHLFDNKVVRDPVDFWKKVETHQISYIKTTPSHFQALMEGRPPDALIFDTIILGGEKLSPQTALKILTEPMSNRLVNHYGPTETTIGSACYILNGIGDIPDDCDSVPIGSAIGNAALFLIDKTNNIGELVITGDGVSAGYYGNEELTQNFITAENNERSYKTGDICKELTPGVFEFIKRNDRRIKILGYLVDPSALEIVIEKHFSIKAAIVDVEHNGHLKLSAVLFTGINTVKNLAEEVKELLKKKVPFYSLPTWIFQLEAPPLTANGKLDYQFLRNSMSALIRLNNKDNAYPEMASDDELATKVIKMWEYCAGIPGMSLLSTFNESGADSILIMQYVARLRKEGLNITIQDMYDYPTPYSLIQAIRQKGTVLKEKNSVSDLHPAFKRLSRAQASFFELSIDDFNHWSQAVVLSSKQSINISALLKAVYNLVQRNEILSQAFVDTQPAFVSNTAINRIVGITQLPDKQEEAELCIITTAEKLQKSISIGEGEMFKLQIFSSVDGLHDKILLIAHHLVVDGVSWRFILEELASSYLLACNNKELLQHRSAEFWSWTAQNESKNQKQEIRSFPDNSKKFGLPISKDSSSENRSYASCILTFDELQTKRIQEFSGDLEQFESYLLQAFADGVGALYTVDLLTVDVERHGRPNAAGSEDFLSTIGWFTSLASLDLNVVNESSFLTQSQQTKTMLKATLPKHPDHKKADLCFNFLGTFHFPIVPGVDWKPSHEYVGPCRCEKGTHDYYITFTARIIENKLTIDILYHSLSITSTEILTVAEIIANRINAIQSDSGVIIHPIIRRESHSTAGLLFLTPKKEESHIGSQAETRSALLTGATGFLGAHLLNRLVETKIYQVKCLVRAQNNEEAYRRLEDSCVAYFGSKRASEIIRKIEVYAGDITKKELGLMPASILHVHDVFHAAADTKLLAPYDELKNTNVTGVQNLIDWMQKHGNPDLHYISTLAVSGKNLNKEFYKFTEQDFNIGQEFLSSYEKSKFEAEEIVRNTISRRTRTHIYRMGHIAAHSITGVFQQNISDNRIYQIARGYIMLGMAPRLIGGSITFSYVDIVAEAIEAIASNNIATGTFHVENPHQVKYSELISTITSHGYRIQLKTLFDFLEEAEIVAQNGDRTAFLTSMWMQRESRNVVYQQDKTVKLLSNLGVHFPMPTSNWLRLALKFAINARFFPDHDHIEFHP